MKRRTKKLLRRTKVDVYDYDACNIHIANWLKDAPKRLKKERKRMEKDNGDNGARDHDVEDDL